MMLQNLVASIWWVLSWVVIFCICVLMLIRRCAKKTTAAVINQGNVGRQMRKYWRSAPGDMLREVMQERAQVARTAAIHPFLEDPHHVNDRQLVVRHGAGTPASGRRNCGDGKHRSRRAAHGKARSNMQSRIEHQKDFANKLSTISHQFMNKLSAISHQSLNNPNDCIESYLNLLRPQHINQTTTKYINKKNCLSS